MIALFMEQTTALYASRETSFAALVKAAGLSPEHDFQGRDLRDLPLAGEDVAGFNFTGSRLEGSGIEQAINLDKAILIDATFKAGSPLIIKAFEQKIRGQEFIKAAKLLVNFLKYHSKATLSLLEKLFTLIEDDLKADIWFYKVRKNFKGFNEAQKHTFCYVILNELKDFLPEEEKIFENLINIMEELKTSRLLNPSAIVISNAIGYEFTPCFKLEQTLENTLGDLPTLFERCSQMPDVEECGQRLFDAFGGRGLRAVRAYVSHDDAVSLYVLNVYLSLKTTGNYKSLTVFEKEEILAPYKNKIKNNNDVAVLSNYAILLTNLHDLFEAEKYCKLVIEIEPYYSFGNYNYAYILFLQGRAAEALPYLLKSNDNEPEVGLKTVNAYLIFAFVDFESLAPLKKLLIEGNRSQGFIEQSLERAAKDNHPNLDLLKALIEVITRNAPIETLEAFAKWRETEV